MTLKQQIKELLNRKNMTMTELVNILNEKYPRETGKPRSIQNFNGKITRESLSYEELKYVAEILDHELVWRHSPKQENK